MFKKASLSVLFAAAVLPFAIASAQAQEAAKAPTAQQSKMATCNQEATGKTGDERKKFMSECLGAKKAEVVDKRKAQQEKMKSCNKEATGKKGDERKKFMSECLKG